MPGIDIDETNSLEDQISVLKSIAKQAPPQTPPQEKPRLPPTTTQQKPTVLPKAKPAPKATVSVKPSVTPKQDLSVPVMSAEQVSNAVGLNQNIQSAVTFGLSAANRVKGVIQFGASVVSALAGLDRY